MLSVGAIGQSHDPHHSLFDTMLIVVLSKMLSKMFSNVTLTPLMSSSLRYNKGGEVHFMLSWA